MAEKKKVVLVTGAGSGIGRATAKRLAADGMAVGVADIAFDGAKKVVEEIIADGGEAIAISVDITNEESVDAMFKAVIDKYGYLDYMVANAGIIINDPFSMLTYDQWNKIESSNGDGTTRCVQRAANNMIKQGNGGKIGITLSQGGFAENNEVTVAYVITKWAGRGLVRSLADKLAPYGITVNAIAPGNIPTPMMDQIISDYATSAGAPAEMISQSMEKMAPLGRLQPAEEMAALYSYMLSDAANSMTGFTIIDNGAGILGS